MKRKSLILLSIVVLVVVAVLLSAFRINSGETSANKIVTIEGIDQCSSGINKNTATTAGTTLYGYVTLANDQNGVTSLPSYTATVRKGSCQQKADHTVDDGSGNQQKVKTSSLIVDISQAKQSWKITYDWVADGADSLTDIGTITPECLASNNLIYGDFGCAKVLNIQKYGTANYDPILQYVPYPGDGFTLDYDSESREVAATILMPVDQKDNQELLQNNEAVVPYWFEHRGLDINKYKVIYAVVYQ